MFLVVLKLVLVLLLNMSSILELSELFASYERLIKFFSAWGARKKILGCGLLEGISTQADTMS